MAGSGAPEAMIVRPSGALRGEAAIPGDKSISHRALILGALSVGRTEIKGLLEGQDVLDTATAMAAFGAGVERLGDGHWQVDGVGVGGFAEPDQVIDCGNSGTGVRLIIGAMATTPIAATFTGDASLRKRPMGRILDPLAKFGAAASGRRQGRLPLTMQGAVDPPPIEYALPMASAQVKSAVLLAGLNAPGETVVIEPEATRDHTERMLRGFGAELSVEDRPEGGRIIRLTGQPMLTASAVTVPSDPSSAAFPIVAALLRPGSEVRAPRVGLNSTRAGIYETLQEMGADLTIENSLETGGERLGDLVARGCSLKGVTVDPARAPSMIDEYPILSVAAAFAEGPTIMRGIGELRVKETDRIGAMARGLAACGVEVEEEPDGLIVHGRGPDGVLGGASVATELDHRIAMSFAVLGLAAQRPVRLDDARPIATSFPSFAPLMTALGAELEPEQQAA